MKLALAILAVVAVVTPLNAYKVPAVGDGALAKELQDLVNLIPINDVLAITRVYLAKDKQFQDLVSLAQSAESQQLIKDLEARKDLNQLLRFIQKKGLDIFYLVKKLNEGLNIPPMVPLEDVDMEIVGGIKGFMIDINNVVPISAILDLLFFKLQHSQVMKDVAHEVTKPEYLRLYEFAVQNVHLVNLKKQAEQIGVDGREFNTYYVIAVFVATIKKYLK